MITFLYCVDENYNLQALTSINSIISNSSDKFEIVIIHKDPSSFEKYKKNILPNDNLQRLQVLKFINNNYLFPEVENSHVSEATYFRLFLTNILSSEIENLVYIDADVVCVSDPFPDLNDEFKEFLQTKSLIGVKTTNVYSDDKDVTLFSRLGIKSSYFNAGVMFINFKRWVESDLSFKLQKHLIEISDKIEYWDQDVLNSYFDGNYYELNEKYNYLLDLNYEFTKSNIQDIEKNIFFHYVGSVKPWTLEGIFRNTSIYYQKYFRKANIEKYHIVSSWKKNDMKFFLKLIKTRKIMTTDMPLALIVSFFRMLISKY